MTTITATFMKNKIGDVWEMVRREPVTVETNGTRLAVILSPEEYDRLRVGAHLEARQPGFAKDLFAGIDTDVLLATPIDDLFAEYMPE